MDQPRRNILTHSALLATGAVAGCALPAGASKAASTPFDLPQTEDDDDLVDRAPMAMKAFADCGVDLLLSGHMHTSHAASTAERYIIHEYAALVIQAGTATSTRGRGEVNSFNVVRVGDERVEVDRYGWDEIGKQYSIMKTEPFLRRGNVWSGHMQGLTALGI